MPAPWGQHGQPLGKGLATRTCFHFYLWNILGALYTLAEILNYWKTEANFYSFILVLAKVLLAYQVVSIAFKCINSAAWRSVQVSLGRTGVKISEWLSYNSSLASRITGVPDVGHHA